MDQPDVEALCSPLGRELLQRLDSYDEATALRLGTSLRQEFPAALVSAALTQARLRRRARGKFGADAERLLFTVEGLEQATRALVAARHAGRYADAGLGRVVDLCCGIGGDLLALARAGLRVHGVDRDPGTVAVATANIAAAGVADRARVSCADVATTDLSPYDGVFCDPSRRARGRRTLSAVDWSPPWSFVAGLLRGPRPAGVKVAPGLDHTLVPPGVEAEWVSVSGSVVEAALWSGALAGGHPRRATLLPAGVTVAGGTAQLPPPVGPVQRYLYEPDGAVLRAGLVDVVADAVGGALLDPTIAYVTSNARVETPLATAYEVEASLPFQLKRLRSTLRNRDIGSVVVKKRGSAVDPDELRRRLRLPGGRAATVVLTRLAGAPWVLIAHPVHTAPVGG